MRLSYLPLDESKDEIRLITLLPMSTAGTRSTRRSEFVQCRLETRSLSAFTPHYQVFMSSPSFPSLNKHNSRIKWSQLHGQSDQIPMQSGQPPDQHHRFNWGDYAALSYVWGDESNTRKITVNGHEMKVTRNLEEALRTFRDASEFHSNFGLWVDAICINQKDFEERGRQVRKMRDIYGKAWTVIAWLGGEGHGSDKAIQLVQKLSEISEKNAGHELALKLEDEPEYLGYGSWYALRELMNRPYWSRLWIIQEMVMGASAMVMRCGNSSIDWNSFCSGIGILQEDLWLIKDNLLRREIATSWSGEHDAWFTTSLHLVYRDLSVLSERDESKQLSLLFWRLIDIANSADCKDPRDKVYGLIGLMDRDLAKEIAPNYTIKPQQVYTEVSKAFIQRYQSLDPIREGNPWGPTKTPSWVADWQWEGSRLSLARIENPLWGPSWLSGKSNANSSTYTPYRSSGASVYEVSFADARLLTCCGFIVDSIAGLSARGRGYFAWSKESIIQAKRWKSIYGCVSQTSKALYKTLVADRVGRGEKSTERHAVILNLPSTFETAEPQFKRLDWVWLAAQESYYFRWEEWRLANKNFQLGDCRLDDYFCDVIPLDSSEYDFTEVYACFDRTCQKRRFMLTEKGYMGWAPDNIYGSNREQTMAGDLIAILFGCSTPIVIRPCGEQFKVIGEAYVQGIMDGEAIELLPEGKVKKQSFTFC